VKLTLIKENEPTKGLGCLTFHEAYALSQDPMHMTLQLQKAGVLHIEEVCNCGAQMNLNSYEQFNDKICWRCPKKACKRRRSIRQGSYFENHNLTLGTIFMILYCTFKFPKMLAKYIADIVEVSENSLVDWGCYIRETISNFFLQNPIVLGTLHSVQIDESMFGGKRKYYRGNHQIHEQSWVFGMVEEVTNRTVLWMVDKRNASTLIPLIKSHIRPGATIKSDEWAAYSSLEKQDFIHLTVNHSVNFVSASGVHTQLIESVWSQVKSGLKVKHGTRYEHLAGYLDLFSFKCEAAFEEKDALCKFLEIIQVDKFY
jgi:IS1 family transposase